MILSKLIILKRKKLPAHLNSIQIDVKYSNVFAISIYIAVYICGIYHRFINKIPYFVLSCVIFFDRNRP